MTPDPTESVAVFAAKVLRQPLWTRQHEAAQSGAFVTTVAAARRTGKSTLAETLAMWTCLRERNVLSIILSATQESSRRMTENIAATLNSNRLTKGAVVDDYSTRIRLDNGSQIISLPASQKQIRGYGKGVKLLILDECGFMDGALYTAAKYVALDERPHSRILLLGTPWGAETHFFRQEFQAGMAGDEDHASYTWTHEANPNLDHTYLKRQREHISPQEYAAEILGQWGSAAGSMFTRELLDSVTADIDYPPLHELDGPARGIVGCDWGLSYDVSAAVAIFRLPVVALNPVRDIRPTFVLLPYTWPQGHPLHKVVADIASAAANFACISTETNGIGGMPSQELARACRAAHPRTRFLWNFVNTTAGSKSTGYGVLLNLMQREQLVLPRHPMLLRQLAAVRFEVRSRGVMGIDTEDAAHDDVADAAYLGCLPYRPPGAHRVVCRLATLAGAGAPPDERTPEMDSPVVTTGAGLRVYQQPPLQGIGARQQGLSLYAPVAPHKPEGIQAGNWFFKTNTGAIT